MSKIEEKNFTETFDRYFVPLCQYAWVYCKDQEQAKEIVQEVFIKIWEMRDKLEIQGAISSYLYQTVKNRSINHLRNGKRLSIIYNLPEEVMEDGESLPNLEAEHLYHAIDQLPERCREIFKLKRLEGLSYKEISIRFSLSEKTIENQMGIALKKLKESLTIIQNQLGD